MEQERNGEGEEKGEGGSNGDTHHDIRYWPGSECGVAQCEPCEGGQGHDTDLSLLLIGPTALIKWAIAFIPACKDRKFSVPDPGNLLKLCLSGMTNGLVINECRSNPNSFPTSLPNTMAMISRRAV